MKVIKYTVELQMLHNITHNHLLNGHHLVKVKTIAEFDNFFDAINELETVAQIYAYSKNVAIEVVKYEFDKVVFEYEYLDKVIGLYGIEAAKHLNLDASKNKKFGLIIA